MKKGGVMPSPSRRGTRSLSARNVMGDEAVPLAAFVPQRTSTRPVVAES